MESFEILDREKVNTSELVIKKSKFLGFVYYVESKEIAEKYVQEVQDKFKDARHVVYAYRLKSTGKFTDDKGPQGTAGKPIYSLIEKENLINVLIVVVRYFGGILLGAGPLTRAYATCAKEALAKCEKVQYKEYIEKEVVCNYNEEEINCRNLKNANCIIQNIERTDKVKITYLEPKED